MFDDEIILENISRTMEIEDQVLEVEEKEMLGSLTLVKFQNIP